MTKASKYGDVTVGLMTDKAISEYKRYLSKLPSKKNCSSEFEYGKECYPSRNKDYRPNLRILRPNYVIHGDDWKTGVLKESREQVIKELKNGQEN